MAPEQKFDRFLHLPFDVREHVYKKVLVLPQQVILYQETPARPVETFVDKPDHWTALLLTCRQISEETRPILYGRNAYNIVGSMPAEEMFLQEAHLAGIGPFNANLLSHLCISFPRVDRLPNRPREPDDDVLAEDALHVLHVLRTHCKGLQTLELYVHRGHGTGRHRLQESVEDPALLREVMAQLDAKLQAIASLDTVIVRFYLDPPAPLIRELMEDRGWLIKICDED